jgi:hypothetical protein
MLIVRASFVCLLTSLILNSHADVGFCQEPEKKPEPAAKSKPAQPVSDETTTRISIHPKAIEAKDLENPLLPPYAEMSSGNAMLEYFRAMASEYTDGRQWTPELEQKKMKWLVMPLDELKAEELRNGGATAVFIMVDGARKTYADMGYLERVKKGGANTLLGEIQAFRSNGRNLRLFTRSEILLKRYDKALDLIRAGLAAPRHLSAQYGNIIYLVANAMANETVASMHDWISRPDTMNLYWPLSQLPRPLLHTDKLMESELLLYDTGFGRHSADEHNRVMSEKQALDFIVSQIRLNVEEGVSFDTPNDPRLNEGTAAFVDKLYPIAFESLKKNGRAEMELKAMPKAQVCAIFHRQVALSQMRRYARWFQFDPWVAIREISRERESRATIYGVELATLPKFVVKDQKFEVFSGQADDTFGLTTTLTKARLETKLNVLSLIEMLRDYAADHPELPESTDALTRYPLNLTDQFTGKPIRYRRIDATTATIEAGPPEGMPGLDFLNQLRYEIRLAK